jgi:predicted RNA-binding protein with PUA-like domain
MSAADSTPSTAWLVKSEPETYSWDDLVREGRTDWTGVRNYAARIHLKAMRVGDPVLFYHSGKSKCIVGLARVTKTAFPDPTADEEGWVAVVLAPVKPLSQPVTLAQVKADSALKDMALVRLGRLSVQPVRPGEFARVQEVGGF